MWNGAASFADPGWKVTFPLNELPDQAQTNYDIIVTVEKPSPRNDDVARLHGLTKIGG